MGEQKAFDRGATAGFFLAVVREPPRCLWSRG